MSNSNDDKTSFGELLMEYQEQENIYRFEGTSALESLNKIANAIGYRESRFRFGSSLEVMLADNPIVCQAIINALSELDIPEWKEELITYLNEKEPEEDEEFDDAQEEIEPKFVVDDN